MKALSVFFNGLFIGFLAGGLFVISAEREEIEKSKQKNNVDEGYQPKHAKESE